MEISDVDEFNGVKNFTEMLFSEAPSRARRVLRSGDVVVSTVRTYLRALARIPDELDGAVGSTGFAVLRPKKVVAGYLAYLTRAGFFIEEVIARSEGVSYPAINAADLVGIPVPVPSTEEQQSISSFLDEETAKIDLLIGKQERLISILRERRQSIIDGYFMSSKENRPRRLRGLLAAKPTYGVLVPAYVEADDSVPFIRVSDLARLPTVSPSAQISKAQSAEYSRTRIVGGEVLLGVVGRMGQVALAPERLAGANVARAVAVLRCSDRTTSELLAIWLTSTMFLDQAGLLTSGDSVQPTLGMGDLAAVSMHWPRDATRVLAELKRELAVIDELNSKAERFIQLSNERRQALISAAVTGKIDVRGLS